MKHDPVINEIRPYSKEPANKSFLTKVHQKYIREVIEEIKDNDQLLEPRDPAEGDLDFESVQDSYPLVNALQQDRPANLFQNRRILDTIIEDDEDDDDDEQ